MKIDDKLKTATQDNIGYLTGIKNLFERYNLNDTDLNEFIKGKKGKEIFKSEKFKVTDREINLLKKFMESD